MSEGTKHLEKLTEQQAWAETAIMREVMADALNNGRTVTSHRQDLYTERSALDSVPIIQYGVAYTFTVHTAPRLLTKEEADKVRPRTEQGMVRPIPVDGWPPHDHPLRRNTFTPTDKEQGWTAERWQVPDKDVLRTAVIRALMRGVEGTCVPRTALDDDFVTIVTDYLQMFLTKQVG